MPRVESRVPNIHRNSLAKRSARQGFVMEYTKMTEPAQVCLTLRRLRRELPIEARAAIKRGDIDGGCKLLARLADVHDRILRLAGIPQAPPGKLAGSHVKSSGPARNQAVLDVVAKIRDYADDTLAPEVPPIPNESGGKSTDCESDALGSA